MIASSSCLLPMILLCLAVGATQLIKAETESVDFQLADVSELHDSIPKSNEQQWNEDSTVTNHYTQPDDDDDNTILNNKPLLSLSLKHSTHSQLSTSLLSAFLPSVQQHWTRLSQSLFPMHQQMFQLSFNSQASKTLICSLFSSIALLLTFKESGLQHKQISTLSKPFLFLSAATLLTTLSHAVNASEAIPSADQLNSLAESALSTSNLPLAVQHYTALITHHPSQLAFYHRSQVYLRQRRYGEAIEDLTQAIQLDAQFIKGLIQRAKLVRLVGQCAESVKDYERVLQQKANHREALNEIDKSRQCVTMIQQSEELYNRRQYEAARDLLSSSLEIASESLHLITLRMKASYELKDYQSVLIDSRLILTNSQTNLDGLYYRGRAYQFLGEYDNALNHYKEALRSDPEHKLSKVSFRLLKKWLKLKMDAEKALQSVNYRRALEDVNDALEIEPESFATSQLELLLLKCRILNGLRRAKEALEVCEKVVAMDENNAQAHLEMTRSYMTLEQYQEAVNAAQTAYNKDPQNPTLQQQLHEAQVELKRSQQKDYYKELGIKRSASAREIKKAYHKLALEWHPDKHEGEEAKTLAEKRFQQIAEAYEILSNPELKEKYDRGEDVKPQPGGGQQQHFHNFNPFGGGFPGGFGGFQFQQGGQHFHFSFG